MSTTVKVSDLIKTLKNAKVFGSAKPMLSHLEKLRDDYELTQKHKYVLKVAIDTDEDFTINGSMMFEGHIIVKDNEEFFAAFKKYISELNFDAVDSKKYKIEYFKEMILNKEVEECLDEAGYVQVGGNQTLEVYMIPHDKFITLSGMSIDLSA